MAFDELSITDKHLGNSVPNLENGKVVNTGAERIYGVLPVSAETLTAGLHPLTQPGVAVPYFYDFNSAVEHALSISTQASGTIGGMQIGMTFLARSEDSVSHRTPEHLTMVGTGPVRPLNVAQVYLTVRDPETYETHTFDTTGMNASGYYSIMATLHREMPIDVMPHLIQAIRKHEQLHELYGIMNRVEDPRIEREVNPIRYAASRTALLDAMREKLGLTEPAPQSGFDAQAHRENVNQMVAEFWKALGPNVSDRINAKYPEFHDKVTQVAHNADAKDALEAGAAWLRSQGTYLDRIAINKAMQSADVQASVEKAQATQERRLDKPQLETLGNIMSPRQENMPDQPDVSDIEEIDEPEEPEEP